MLLFSSCSLFFEHDADDSQSSTSEVSSTQGKTYLSINIGSKTAAKTIRPNTVSVDALTNFKLFGKSFSSLETKVLAEAGNKDGLPNHIEITPGDWEFTLTANYGSALYSATTPARIEADVNNPIFFMLSPQGEFGSFVLTVDLTDNSSVAKVNANLKTVADEAIDSKEFSLADSASRVIEYSKVNLTPGTYNISFDFFADANDPTPINNWESYIIIKAGTITEESINLNFNQVYTITYDYTSVDGTAGQFAGGIQINKYSARSSFDLPKGKPTDPSNLKSLIGWRNTTTSEIITKITPGTTGNLNLQAVYAYNVLYVSNNVSGEAGADVIIGDEANSGFTPDSPLKSIDKACEIIAANPHPDVDWTIYVTGSIATAGADLSGANQYKQSTIPDTITQADAKSILITGAREPDANGLPVDEINRKMNRSATTDTSIYGTGLVISTSVPVTIKNLKITHAKNISETNCGGAIRVETAATVTLGDGVWLHDNYAENGGGVYNAGNLYIVGSAIIGDPTKSTQADGYSTVNNSSCYADQGGAIYNVGCLYLGYSNYISEIENTPEEWTGGLFYNYSTSGGAIYNKKDATVVMKSGTLAFNSNGSSGSGGGAVYNLGTFKMKGGSIENNSARAKNGGGFFNAQNNTDGSGTFIFTGGTIKSNKIVYGSGGTFPNGGGVYNAGNMYVYGNAVIGDASATTAATDANNCSNFAVGFGGGIFVPSTGKLYLGYKSFTSLTENEPEPWNGGIYYNYAGHNCTDTGGGGIGSDGGTIYMHSGTIANNGTVYKDTAAGFNYDGKGAAVYQSGSFYLSGSASIPAGTYGKQDIYINNYTDTKIVTVSGRLADTFSATITPYYYESGSTQKPALSIASGADTDMDTERVKFNITPQVDTAANMTSYWMIDSGGMIARNGGAFPFQITFAKPSFSTVGMSVKQNNDSGTNVTSSGVPVGTTVCLFTTNDSFTQHVWHIDGKSVSEVAGASTSTYRSDPDALLTLNTTGWTPGYHDITLDVYDTSDHYVSAVYQLKLNAN